MIEISIQTGLTAVILGWILFRLSACFQTKRLNVKYETTQLFFLINLLVIYRFTFHPFSTVNGAVQPLIFDLATAWPFRMNLIPFVHLLDYDSMRDLLINLIGNFAMFIPTGVMTPLIYKSLGSFKKTFLTGALLSLAIEVIQLPFAVRASDVDDLILNTAGCAVGYAIYVLSRWLKSVIHRKIIISHNVSYSRPSFG